MLKEKYIEFINKFLNEIEDERTIKMIYNIVQMYWLRSDQDIKKDTSAAQSKVSKGQ